MTIANYYANKALSYGMSSTRMRKILGIVSHYSGKRILDVGCATGYLGEKLKNRGNYVVGLDISPLAVDQAKKRLDEAFVYNLGSDETFPTKEKFDLIIMSEVVEHLFSPKKAINRLKHQLKPGGELLISTPNFLHIANRKRFLLGDFHYEDSGVFDEGHIRFFTHKSLISMMADLGFVSIRENHVFSPNFISFFPGLFAYQFVSLFSVTKKSKDYTS